MPWPLEPKPKSAGDDYRNPYITAENFRAIARNMRRDSVRDMGGITANDWEAKADEIEREADNASGIKHA